MMSRACAWLFFWLCLGPQTSTQMAPQPLQINQLYQFGSEVGDRQLEPGSDSTAEVLLNRTLFVYREKHDRVFINTNGFVSLVKPPSEDGYLGKTPAGLKMVAALLGDLDSLGQGAVFYREDSNPAVLNDTAEQIQQAFPLEKEVVPESVLIVTWENMVARGETDLGLNSVIQRNTFQLVLAFMASSSYAIHMYPIEGLQFLSTTIKGQSRTMLAGFDEGQVAGWWKWTFSQGEHMELTDEDEISVLNLARKSNSGQAGVWIYQIGASSFEGIKSGVALLSGNESSPPVTMLPRKPDQQQEVILSPTIEPTTTLLQETPTLSPGESYHHNYTSDNQTESSLPDTLDTNEFQTKEPELEAFYYNQTHYVEQNQTESPKHSKTASPDQTDSIGHNQSESIGLNPPDKQKSAVLEQPDHSKFEGQIEIDGPHSAGADLVDYEGPEQPHSEVTDQPDQTESVTLDPPDIPKSIGHREPEDPHSADTAKLDYRGLDHPHSEGTNQPDQTESVSPDKSDLPESIGHKEQDDPQSAGIDQLYSAGSDQPKSVGPDQPDQTEYISPEQSQRQGPDQLDKQESAGLDQSVSVVNKDSDQPESSDPDLPDSTVHFQPKATGSSDSAETLNRTHIRYSIYEPSEPRLPEPPMPRKPSMVPQYTDPGLIPPLPPYTGPQHPQIIVVDEDLDVDVFSYNLDTCEHSRHKCSAFAECRDYSDGYCCHCRPGFYGDGKDCVGEGRPQRMTGKVRGQVFVGDSSQPVTLNNSDLHSYIVANDGRAYVAVSNVNGDLGPAMQPLSSVGGVIGWAFALEQPESQNGFRLIGGTFTRQAEVIFHPGNERLTIRQDFSGLDQHEHLVVSTRLDGRIPDISPGSSVHILPYKEIYQYDQTLISSSSNRDYTINSPEGGVESRSYQWRQTISFQNCPHQQTGKSMLSTQQLNVDQIFVMYDSENRLIRYATTNKIGPIHGGAPEQNPCFTGRHGCDINAMCHHGNGVQFRCECTTGYYGDGRNCQDVDECSSRADICGSNSVCLNQPGSFSCRCLEGFTMDPQTRACVAQHRPLDHCAAGTHTCDVHERARCSYVGGSAFVCSCLPGFHGDGHHCHDVDECGRAQCHQDASCTNTPGSYSCQCLPGFQGDGFQCNPPERELSPCERHRLEAEESRASSGFFSFFRPSNAPHIPQCDQRGAYEPSQCHASVGQCWCVNANGQEIPDTRTTSGHSAMCIDQTVTPPPIGPTPRPDVRPSGPGNYLLFAQSGKIEQVPLDGHGLKEELARTLLHVPDRVVIAVTYDCVERAVYWSDITAPSISRASVSGGDIVPIITKELQSPEGVAVDHLSRLLFWTDSMKDTVEVSRLDGSHRRVLFDTDLVNPRPIVTNPTYGQLFWADWDRDGPKIEMSNMDGTDRNILVNQDLSLPNGLTFDPDTQQLCWADAGIHRVECLDPHRRLRRIIVEGVHYPFGLAQNGQKLFYTDWRREAVVGVDARLHEETEEFLPQRRSRLYGITTVTAECRQGYNYCLNNGGCSHLCLPKPGGFTCRCPDNTGNSCVETH